MTHSCHKSKERSNTQKKQESIQIKRVKPLQQLVAAAREDEKANPPQLNCFLLPECFSVGPTAVVFQLQWFSHFPQLALLKWSKDFCNMGISLELKLCLGNCNLVDEPVMPDKQV